jgi:poly(U)-specific endoribonuclease
MNFLTQKGIVTSDPQTHKELLKTIWFGLYSRGMGKIGSSGFEHVFLSEVKNGTVMGLHNWIYLSEVEKAGDLDYKGWSKKIDLGNVGTFDFVGDFRRFISFAFAEGTNCQDSLFTEQS